MPERILADRKSGNGNRGALEVHELVLRAEPASELVAISLRAEHAVRSRRHQPADGVRPDLPEPGVLARLLRVLVHERQELDVWTELPEPLHAPLAGNRLALQAADEDREPVDAGARGVDEMEVAGVGRKEFPEDEAVPGASTMAVHVTESPAEFAHRTGGSYDPPPAIAMAARALAPDERCPTLFRFPGACGLAEYFLGSMTTLAKPANAELWAAADPLNGEVPGVVHFGTFALLQPLRFGMCEASPGLWVGANRAIDDPGRILWIPPSATAARIPWDRIADASDAVAWLGSGVDRERDEVIDSLDLYAREVEDIARAGVPDPEIRWCDRPEELRARLLAEFGLGATWTGTTRARAAAAVRR